jgi:hypothetical protein
MNVARSSTFNRSRRTRSSEAFCCARRAAARAADLLCTFAMGQTLNPTRANPPRPAPHSPLPCNSQQPAARTCHHPSRTHPARTAPAWNSAATRRRAHAAHRRRVHTRGRRESAATTNPPPPDPPHGPTPRTNRKSWANQQLPAAQHQKAPHRPTRSRHRQPSQLSGSGPVSSR